MRTPTDRKNQLPSHLVPLALKIIRAHIYRRAFWASSDAKEDLVQDSILLLCKAYRNSNVEHEGKLVTYLCGLVTFRAIRNYRELHGIGYTEKRSRVECELNETTMSSYFTHSDVSDSLDAKKLLALIDDKLTTKKKERTANRLKIVFDGMALEKTDAEIAKELGVTRQAVNIYFNKIKEKANAIRNRHER